MAKFSISALEQAVLSNIQSIGSNKSIPSKMLTSGNAPIKPAQVGAVVNNMVSKGLLVREYDLFGPKVSLTRSGKIRSTKMLKLAA